VFAFFIDLSYDPMDRMQVLS